MNRVVVIEITNDEEEYQHEHHSYRSMIASCTIVLNINFKLMLWWNESTSLIFKSDTRKIDLGNVKCENYHRAEKASLLGLILVTLLFNFLAF